MSADNSAGDLSRRLEIAREQEQKKIDVLFSTKPVQVRVGRRKFLVPANYLTAKGRDLPSTLDASLLQFVLFLPGFEGYTKTNWGQGFNPNRIDVIEVSEDNSHRTPQRFLDSRSPSLEPSPFQELAGLGGYRWKNRDIRGVTWCGNRPGNEFFCLETTVAPGDRSLPSMHPLCRVQYFRQSKGMFVAYHYSMEHLMRWAQIDEAIWDKLQQWSAK